MMNYLNELLKKKELGENTSEDMEKINIIKDLFKEADIFFKLDIDTAYGILYFLGVPKEEIESTYMSLTSPEEYMKNVNPYFMGPVK